MSRIQGVHARWTLFVHNLPMDIYVNEKKLMSNMFGGITLDMYKQGLNSYTYIYVGIPIV